MTNKPIGPTSPTLKLRGGGEFKIFIHDNGKGFILGAAKSAGVWLAIAWNKFGRYYEVGESPYDLIEVKPRVKAEAWINVYKHDNGTYTAGTSASPSKEIANKNTGFGNRVACVKLVIDCEEGEGL